MCFEVVTLWQYVNVCICVFLFTTEHTDSPLRHHSVTSSSYDMYFNFPLTSLWFMRLSSDMIRNWTHFILQDLILTLFSHDYCDILWHFIFYISNLFYIRVISLAFFCGVAVDYIAHMRTLSEVLAEFIASSYSSLKFFFLADKKAKNWADLPPLIGR